MHYIRPHLGKIAAVILLAFAIALTIQHAISRWQADMLQQMDERLDAMAERHAAATVQTTAQLEEIAADLRNEMAELREELRQELELPPLDLPLSANLQRHVFYRCAQIGFAPGDFFAIMYHESGFDPAAVGHNRNGTTDVGLMQINSVNWKWLAELGVNVHTPEGSIDAAAVILAQLQAKGYAREQVLAAYAAGEAGMLRGGGFWYPKAINTIQIM